MTQQPPAHTPDWGACIFDHYTEFLGEPQKLIKYAGDGHLPPLLVLQFENVFGGCQAFCSMGYKRKQVFGQVAEICLAVDEVWEYTSDIFAHALGMVIHATSDESAGIAVRFDTLGDFHEAFAKKFCKPALYVTSWPSNFPEKFGEVKCGYESARFFLAFFITLEEFEYWRRYGSDAFENLLEEKTVDVLCLNRISAT